MTSSLFFINVKTESKICLSFGEWICTESLTQNFLQDIKNNEYRVAFISQENIFSHSMNVFRKTLFQKDTIAVIGIKEILYTLQNACSCIIDIINDSIFIGETEFKFKRFNYLRDTSESIEYNLDTKEICYKPDYYYNNELASIIVKGYNMTHSMLPSYHISRSDKQGRIWDKGFIFPSHFFEYYINNPQKYYSSLIKYIKVLKSILSFSTSKNNSEALIDLLAIHYSYSIIFSFITPNIAEKIKNMYGEDFLQKIYNEFVSESPIHNKYQMVDKAIEKMEYYLKCILDKKTNSKYKSQIYHISDNSLDSLEVMYFVTNMFSDIRRCVINITIERNPWFEKICRHRKKVKIY